MIAYSNDKKGQRRKSLPFAVSARRSALSASSAREGVGPQLEFHQLALGALAAFDVPHEVRAVIRIEPATFPAAVRIVDASVEPARIEAERIRHTQRRPLLLLRIQHQQ